LSAAAVAALTLFGSTRAFASASQGPASESATAAISQFASAWSTVRAYDATVTVFESKGDQVQHLVLDYSYQKPSTASIKVLAGPNAGATLVWSGGDTIVAHRGSGFSALFKKSLSLHDPQVTTLRGASLDQLSFGAILAHGRDDGGAISVAPGETIAGTPTVAITLVPSNPAADCGFTREVVEVSEATHLPLRVFGYSGATLVRQLDFANVKLQTETVAGQ
jgi:hypothetical protein